MTIVFGSERISHLGESVLRSSFVEVGLVSVHRLTELLFNLVDMLFILVFLHVRVRHGDVIL